MSTPDRRPQASSRQPIPSQSGALDTSHPKAANPDRGPGRRLRRSGFALLAALVLLSGCTPESTGPSVDEVLNGDVAAAERGSAIEFVRTTLASLPDAVDTIDLGTRIIAFCTEGQNNWKVQEGFRLRCTVYGARYIAWSGPFSRGKSAITEAFERVCGAPSGEALPTAAPRGELGTPGGGYDCATDATVGITWATSTIGLSTSSLGLRCDGPDARCVAGPDASTLDSGLAPYDWLSVQATSREYYED